MSILSSVSFDTKKTQSKPITVNSFFFELFYPLRRKDAKSKEESRRKDEVDRKGSKDSKVQQLETKYSLIV